MAGSGPPTSSKISAPMCISPTRSATIVTRLPPERFLYDLALPQWIGR
jgi:hypothetical protein